MIEIQLNTVIYVMCPPNYATGGPELLHQLTSKLNEIGIPAKMYYYPLTESNPVHPNYVKYNTDYTSVIEDVAANILIVPEVLIAEVNKLNALSNIRKCIWWLSVDNFFSPLNGGYLTRLFRKLNFNAGVQMLEARFFKSMLTEKGYRYHLVQSEYALKFLGNKGIPSFYLSDYLNDTFIDSSKYTDLSAKENIVLYNPKKGIKFTQQLVERFPDFRWIPLINFSPEEVAALLKKAKVYIDFGNHPGKDRFPREAAVLFCCIITGCKGSAKFYEDVRIPEKYKIADQSKNIEKIGELIKSCLNDHQAHLTNFKLYRDTIIDEEQNFLLDLQKIFVRKVV